MIRTAIPFGYLFIVLFLAVAFFIGAAFLVWGCVRRKRTPVILGLITLFGIIGLVVAEVTVDLAMEWNPTISDDSAVVGTWTSDRESVTLRSDHTVDYRSDTEGFSGKWKRDDWNLYLTAEDVDTTMRFITFRKKLRLMSNPP